MEAFRWIAGLFVSLVFGGIVTQVYARRIRKLVGDEDPHYRISIPISLGVAENLFFYHWRSISFIRCSGGHGDM
jgi:hypothetical protein